MTILSMSVDAKTPSSRESATAFATAAWTGPNISFTWSTFFRVTFGMTRVAGLVRRFGRMTARRGVCPAESCERAFANAAPTGPSLSPTMRSMCASSRAIPDEGFSDAVHGHAPFPDRSWCPGV